MNHPVRAWPVAALFVALACPSRGPSESPQPLLPTHDDDESSSSSSEAAPASEHEQTFEPAIGDCEGLCGQLAECLLSEPPPALTTHQAAALELDCLQRCVGSGPPLADSSFAACANAEACTSLLPCMREAWPHEEQEGGEPEPVIVPSGSGCRQGCERLGHCFGSTPDEIDTCAGGCEQVLDADTQAEFGECTQTSDCLEMLECMRKFPGA